MQVIVSLGCKTVVIVMNEYLVNFGHFFKSVSGSMKKLFCAFKSFFLKKNQNVWAVNG
jgi:hypothetical protein